MNISNAEKQARFRKKEELKRGADQIFRETQQGPTFNQSSSQENLQFLNEAIDLPSGWTDEDYELAKRKLEQFRIDAISTEDQINNDVMDSLVINQNSLTKPALGKQVDEARAAIDDARVLAAHIISALRLSNCTDVEQSAALLEAVRLVGRSLANQSIVPRSNATAMCLATLKPHYERPEWFAEQIAKTLAYRLGKDLTRDVGGQLTNFDYGAFL